MADETSIPAQGGVTSSATPSRTINVGTRRSALALRQAETVVADLRRLHPGVDFQVRAVSVMGDVDKSTPLAALSQQMGGKGLWTSELEAMLARGDLDMVVHCLKDMPTALPAGCALGAVLEREDPRDVLVLPVVVAADGGAAPPTPLTVAELPHGSTIGTSSQRRVAQLRRRYGASHGFKFVDIRGNIDTRLRKLDDPAGPYDAIVLAAAGLLRMGQGERIAQYLESDARSAEGGKGNGGGGGGVLYAVGQGALTIEVREGDANILTLIQGVVHPDTTLATAAERAVMRALEGGCSVPIGVETRWVSASSGTAAAAGSDGGDRMLELRATVVSLDGAEGADAVLAKGVRTEADAVELGREVARMLVQSGAQKILDVINQNRAAAAASEAAAAAAGIDDAPPVKATTAGSGA